MRNQPKYNLFKNTKYAIDGLIYAFKSESSFKLEILSAMLIIPIIIFIDISLLSKSILLITIFLVLIVELLNTAIENIVDLVTSDYHELAKHAKDVGATAVMFSISLHILCWILVLLELNSPLL